MHHFDRLILVKDGSMIGDHASGMAAISDLADLYQIQLDAIERDGSPPLVFPRASLGPNTL
jgi:iron complex transport system ATP-binding protein